MTTSTSRFRRLGKKLLNPNSRLVAANGGGFVLLLGGKRRKNPAKISADMLADWRRADFLQDTGDGYVVSAVGRAHLRRHLGGDFTAQHKADLQAGGDDTPRQVATTALQWMRARGRHKAYGLNDMELQAGQRLHDDYHSAQAQPHQTMDWERPVFVDGGTGGAATPLSDKALDAQKRLVSALAYIGPGLSDLAVELCCHELGLAAMEKKNALPRRSGKIMLKLALMRLSVHYGYQSANAAAASFRMR